MSRVPLAAASSLGTPGGKSERRLPQVSQTPNYIQLLLWEQITQTMAYMFQGAAMFNQPIGSWVTSSVTDFLPDVWLFNFGLPVASVHIKSPKRNE